MQKVINIIFLIFIVLISSSFTEDGRWIIDPQSRLTIHGTTNVNKFKCQFDCLDNADTLAYFRDISLAELRFTKNKMSLPVRNFNCGNKQITKDFWQTLKSDQYPVLDIVFKSFKTTALKNNSYVDGTLQITLAGVTRQYIVRYYVKTPDQSTVSLHGKQEVSFSDFKLQAPEKMMGLIQVQECLNVEFNLLLKAI